MCKWLNDIMLLQFGYNAILNSSSRYVKKNIIGVPSMMPNDKFDLYFFSLPLTQLPNWWNAGKYSGPRLELITR